MKQNTPKLMVAIPAETSPDSGRQVTALNLASEMKPRHRWLLASFLMIAVLPTLGAAAYLFGVAQNQYHSVAAFSIRSEEITNPLDTLSAFTNVGSTSATDSAILYDYLLSQPLVEQMDKRLDLRGMFTKYPDDLVFALKQEATIEDLIEYWERMVSVAVDSAASTILVEIRAFDPEDAQAIAEEVVKESARLVNELSQIAQEDAMRFSDEDLDTARSRLREIRQRVREFRSEHNIINPEADVESHMGVVAELQSKLAELLIRQGGLQEYADKGDVRLQTLDRDIRAIRAQIANERAVVSGTDPGESSLSEVIGEYEELLVDLRFSEDAYTAAMALAEQARAEARRKSRYAALHIPPTRAQDSIYPKRLLLTSFVALCCMAAWAIGALVFYNVRDRA